MQRATLLISRNAGVEWKGGGELLLPSWYPLTWFVILLRWGILLAMAVFWSWQFALAVAVVGAVLTTVLPIPYAAYKGIFRRRVHELTLRNPIVGVQLEQMLERVPF